MIYTIIIIPETAWLCVWVHPGAPTGGGESEIDPIFIIFLAIVLPSFFTLAS